MMTGPAVAMSTSRSFRAADRERSDVIDIGTRKQLFIDRRFIAESRNVTLKLAKPDLQRENLMPPERPWESGRVCAIGSVVQHEGKVLLWYDAREWDPETKAPTNTRRICYAESEDGVHFARPDLGLIEWYGSKDNNMVMIGATGHMFVDHHDVPEKRFKAIMDMRPELAILRWAELEGTKRHWTCLFRSADGIHWRRSEKVVFPLYLGHKQCAIWDDRLGKWVLYLRAHRPHRCFGRVTVEEGKLEEPYPFNPLPGKDYNEPGKVTLTTELPIVMDRDDRDPPGAQPYTMNAWKYPEAEDVYLAFVPMWYDACRGTGASDRVEVQLAVSRDGIDWQRPWRRPLIPPGAPSMPAAGQVWPFAEPIIRGREIWLYYLSDPQAHLARQNRPNYLSSAESRLLDRPEPNTGNVARAIWWLDRFVAVDAGPDGGEVVTPLLRYGGNELLVNANGGASGQMRVAIEGPDGKPIPGHSLDDCIPIQGNGVALEVRWRQKRSVASLIGRPVRLRFQLTNCELFAFHLHEV